MNRILHAASAVWRFYRDGFRNMTWGRTLWIIIFVVLRLFFFQPVLKGLSDTEKQETVGRNLTPKSSVPL